MGGMGTVRNFLLFLFSLAQIITPLAVYSFQGRARLASSRPLASCCCFRALYRAPFSWQPFRSMQPISDPCRRASHDRIGCHSDAH